MTSNGPATSASSLSFIDINAMARKNASATLPPTSNWRGGSALPRQSMMLRTSAATSIGPRYEGSVMPSPLSQLTSNVPAPMDTAIRMLPYITVQLLPLGAGAARRAVEALAASTAPAAVAVAPAGTPAANPE